MAFTLTQKEIIKTFWQMLDEMPYDDITVQALVERCGLSRNTFYYHFADLPALVESTVSDWLERMSEQQGPFANMLDCIVPIAREGEKHKKALRRLYHMSHRDVFERGVQRVMKLIVARYVQSAVDIKTPPADRELTERFFRSVLSGVLLDWLRSDMSYDLEAFVRRVYDRFSGPEWAKLPAELAGAPQNQDA